MIGAGLPLPGPGAASSPSQGPSPGGPQTPSTSGCSTPAKASAPGRDAGRVNGRADGEHDDGPSFDRMLDAGSGSGEAAEATASTPSGNAPAAKAGDADQAATAGSSSQDASPSPAALPDQLLAMLASLAPVAAPTGAATGTAAGAGASATPAAGVGPGLGGPLLPGAAGPGAAAATLPLAGADTSGAATTGADLAFALPAPGADREPGPSLDAGPTGAGALDPGALQAAGTVVPTPGAREPAPVVIAPLTVALPVDPQAGLDEAFGGNLLWMADQKLGHAEIRVTPENMGPIDVRLHVDGAKVRAEFFSAQPDVRQALESGMVRLRDMLGQHGLQLAHADVGHRQSQAQGSGSGGPERGADASGDPDAAPLAARPVLRSRGLLDEYA